MLRSLLTHSTRIPIKVVGSPSVRSFQTFKGGSSSDPAPSEPTLPPDVQEALNKLGMERGFFRWSHVYRKARGLDETKPPRPMSMSWACILYGANHKIYRKTYKMIVDEGGEAICFHDFVGNGFGDTKEEALLE